MSEAEPRCEHEFGLTVSLSDDLPCAWPGCKMRVAGNALRVPRSSALQSLKVMENVVYDPRLTLRLLTWDYYRMRDVYDDGSVRFWWNYDDGPTNLGAVGRGKT